MTTLLEKAFSEATHLSEEQQDQLAKIILDVMTDDKRWDELFANSGNALADMVAEALTEYGQGKTKPCTLDAK
jgi:hypothetical protein